MTWDPGIVYLRVKYKNGDEAVTWHSTWSRVQFIENANKYWRKEGHRIELITEQEYRDQKWGRVAHAG